MYDVQSLRQTEFPHSREITYLNHAGISPLPQRAKREIMAAVEALSGDPSDYFGKTAFPALIALQTGLARFVNAATPSEIVPITSTSAALNAIAQAIQAVDPELIMVCLSNSRMVEAAQAAGLRCVEEVFADRAYTREGKLVPRSQPGAVIHDAQAAAERVLAMVRDRQVIAIDGTPVPLTAQTVCVHGDTAEAMAMIRRIRARLEAEGVQLKAFGA